MQKNAYDLTKSYGLRKSGATYYIIITKRFCRK